MSLGIRTNDVGLGPHSGIAAAGDWSDDALAIQRICPWQQLRRCQLSMSYLAACCAPGDMYSAGILLAELATGSVPFPGTDLSQQGMSDEDYTAHTASIVQQARDKSWVSFRF